MRVDYCYKHILLMTIDLLNSLARRQRNYVSNAQEFDFVSRLNHRFMNEKQYLIVVLFEHDNISQLKKR